MLMPGRHSNSEKYRFGFNGKEKDDELKGIGNSYDFGARIYDPRVGRWLSLDPLQEKYPSLSPYHSFANSPISIIDSDGKENIIYIYIHTKNEKGETVISKADEKLLMKNIEEAFNKTILGKEGLYKIVFTNRVITYDELDDNDEGQGDKSDISAVVGHIVGVNRELYEKKIGDASEAEFGRPGGKTASGMSGEIKPLGVVFWVFNKADLDRVPLRLVHEIVHRYTDNAKRKTDPNYIQTDDEDHDNSENNLMMDGQLLENKMQNLKGIGNFAKNGLFKILPYRLRSIIYNHNGKKPKANISSSAIHDYSKEKKDE